MVVQHNLSAMNTNRMLGITTKSLAKSTEKLSSGYQINRAADNAAGLSISEKMRKQIRGLTQASKNAEDAISAVQTAEGALAEVTDMLQRINELAVQAANGTNSETDRSYIQDEVDQLVTEIDRVAETSKFNETYLLRGNTIAEKGYTYSYRKWLDDKAATATFSADSASGLKATISFMSTGGTTAEQNDLAKALRNQGLTITSSFDSGLNKTIYTVSINGTATDTFSIVTMSAARDDNTGSFEIVNASGTKIANLTLSLVDSAGTAITTYTGTDRAVITASTISAAQRKNELASYYDKDGNAIPANALDRYVSTGANGNVYVDSNGTHVYDAVGKRVKIDTTSGADGKGLIANTRNLVAALRMSFHVGADSSSNNKITVDIMAMSAKALGINGLTVDGEDSKNADSTVDIVSEAIQKVSTQRSKLGAVQNRLEHTIKNLDNIVENTTSAESAIRDTDMAKEMVAYSNTNILAQAGQAMLAQANQANQGVLSLLG